MNALLVSVRIPVVPVDDTEATMLLDYRFRVMSGQPEFPIQPVFSNDPEQKKKFRGLAGDLAALEAGHVLGRLPACFSTWVEVTVIPQIHTHGNSNMLGAAAGFIAARAANYASLRTLAATGALRLPTSERDAQGSLGHCIEVLPVASLLKKLDAILAEPQPSEGLLVALPADDHPSDAADSIKIQQRIVSLRERGDEVVRAKRLEDVIKAWIPAASWTTPELAAAYAGLQASDSNVMPHADDDPIQTSATISPTDKKDAQIPSTDDEANSRTRPKPKWPKRLVGFTAATLNVIGAIAWIMIPPTGIVIRPKPQPPPPLPFDADQCSPDGQAPMPNSADGREAADAVCRAVIACDAAAGSPLDPDRHERGFSVGVSFMYLQQPERAATARKLCEAAQLVAPTSAKTQWHLSRIHDAQGDTADATRLREQAANAGEPMARQRQAEDLRDTGEAKAARDQLQLLANRLPPPPDAVYEYARMVSCGVGGARDPAAAVALAPRLRDLAQAYGAAFAKGTDLADRVQEAGTTPDIPNWCKPSP